MWDIHMISFQDYYTIHFCNTHTQKDMGRLWRQYLFFLWHDIYVTLEFWPCCVWCLNSWAHVRQRWRKLTFSLTLSIKATTQPFAYYHGCHPRQYFGLILLSYDKFPLHTTHVMKPLASLDLSQLWQYLTQPTIIWTSFFVMFINLLSSYP